MGHTYTKYICCFSDLCLTGCPVFFISYIWQSYQGTVAGQDSLTGAGAMHTWSKREASGGGWGQMAEGQ